MEHTGSCRRGWDWMKEGKGTNQRTFMYDPWTWTTVWRLTVGREGVGLGGGGKREQSENNCNSINSKKNKNIHFFSFCVSSFFKITQNIPKSDCFHTSKSCKYHFKRQTF